MENSQNAIVDDGEFNPDGLLEDDTTSEETQNEVVMENSQNAVVDDGELNTDGLLEDEATSKETWNSVLTDNAEKSNEDEDPEKLAPSSKSKKNKKATQKDRKATRFSLRITKDRGQELKRTWSEVKSVLQKHHLSGRLHLKKDCSVTIISRNKKTRDKARYPPLDVFKLLDKNMELEFIEIGDENSAGFDMEEHEQRLGRLAGPNGSNMKGLQRITNTFIHIGKFRIAVVGLSDNIKQVRRAVEDCMFDTKPPVSTSLWWVSKDRSTNCENSSKKFECDHHKTETPSKKKMEEGLCDHWAIDLEILSEKNSEAVLTTYGTLRPPLGMRRLNAVKSIAGSLRKSSDSEAAAKDLIRFGGVERLLDLFFKYPFNNLLHRQVEKIIVFCLMSTNDASEIVHHLLHDCDLVGKILEAEKSSMAAYSSKPTAVTECKTPPRMGNIGHIARIMNTIIELGNGNSMIQAYMEQNSDEWTDWYRNVLQKRNAVEDVSQWECGHPKSIILG